VNSKQSLIGHQARDPAQNTAAPGHARRNRDRRPTVPICVNLCSSKFAHGPLATSDKSVVPASPRSYRALALPLIRVHLCPFVVVPICVHSTSPVAPCYLGQVGGSVSEVKDAAAEVPG
jgi:hypothetical protein